MAEGRLPVSGKNIQYLALDSQESFRGKVVEMSKDSDLVIFGFDLEGLSERRSAVFENHPDLGEVLFVRAPSAIKID
jgi:aminopeptidase C